MWHLQALHMARINRTGNFNGRDKFGDLDVDGRIILKWIIR
jgi:hypothetical protein